jgi:hypothetical protein
VCFRPPLILDTASVPLAAVRAERRATLRALQQLLGGLAAQLEASGAAEQGLVVARRGRLCVAIKAARRGDIRGGGIALVMKLAGQTKSQHGAPDKVWVDDTGFFV